jgi:predicted DNA-binding transcriptional regulator AlpA
VNLIRKIPLAEKLGVTPRTVADRVRNGSLPPPIYIASIPYWNLDELDAFVQQKMAERPTKNAA